MIISAYAPHNLRPHDERHNFYVDLGCLLDATSVIGAKYCIGDFNARLGQRRQGEDEVIGPHNFGLEAVHEVESQSCDLVLAFCTVREFVVANTSEEMPI